MQVLITRTTAVFLMLSLVVTACGPRIPEEEFARVGFVEGEAGAAAGPGGDTVAGGVDGELGGSVSAKEEFGPLQSEAVNGNRSQGGQPEQQSEAVNGNRSQGGQPEQPQAGDETANGAAADPRGRRGEAPQAREPIVIASVSNLTGPAGTAMRGGLEATQVAIRTINDEGGINGRSVEFLVVDDQNDPARHRSAVQNLVENRGVVAFVGMFASTTHSAVEYLEERGIPVIGGEGSKVRPWYESPMYFSVLGYSPREGRMAVLASAARFTDGRRLGTLVCQEAETCTESERYYAEVAESQGFELVYQGRASLAQPDFTAECIQMRNARVEVLTPAFDTNALRRIAQSCDRQGIDLRYAFPPGQADISFAEMDAFQGLAVASPVFPFTGVEGHPAVDKFNKAIERYFPDHTIFDPMAAVGWVSAQAFAKAAAASGDAPPTSKSILEALWNFKGETLGGLTSGLTFRKGQPSPAGGECYIPMVIKNHRWVVPDGVRFTCGL